MNLPDSIYEDNFVSVALNLEVLRHENIGEGVFRALCKANGSDCKRVHQPHLVLNPVWDVGGRIVASWFGDFLEIAYQHQIEGQTIIVHKS